MGSVIHSFLLPMLACLLLLIACGSESKRELPKPADSQQAPLLEKNSESSAVETHPVKVIPEVKTDKDPKASLLDAIKVGSDDNIGAAARSVLSVSPNDAVALNSLAVLALKHSKPLMAKLLINRAMTSGADSWELWNNLAICHFQSGDDRSGVKALRKAFELNPQEPTVAANLGAHFLEGRDYKKAIFAMEIAEKRPTKDWRVLNNIAIAQSYKGQFGQAKKFYEEALKESPSNKEVLFNLAVLKIQHEKKPNEGLEILQKLRFLGLSTELKNRVNALETRAKMR